MLPAKSPVHVLRVKRSTFGFDEGILFYKKGLYLHVPHSGKRLLDQEESWRNFSWHDYSVSQSAHLDQWWSALLQNAEQYNENHFTTPQDLTQRYMRICPDQDQVGFFLPGDTLAGAHKDQSWQEHFALMAELLATVFRSEKVLEGKSLTSLPAQLVVKTELLKEDAFTDSEPLTGVIIDKIIRSSLATIEEEHHTLGNPQLLSATDSRQMLRLMKGHSLTGMSLDAVWRTPQKNRACRIWWRPALPHELENQLLDSLWS